VRADALSLDVVLNERQQWVVPVYQRHYEWETGEDKQIPKLWDDLKDKAIEHLDERIPYPHYFGAVIFSDPQRQQYGAVRKRYLVDGQQRITTFFLVLLTLREIARNVEIPRIENVASSYLFNEESKGMADPEKEKYKLWPSSYDRVLYQQIVDNPRDELRKLQKQCFYKNGNMIVGKAPKLLRAYWHLYEAIEAFIAERSDENTAEEVLDALLAGFLSGFQIVMISLDENDDAQEIFASLNGMAKPLTPFDLIRNDVFHRARRAGEDNEQLFEKKWKYFESPFWNEPVRQGRFKRARADHLITHAVVAETAREVNAGKIATEYRHFASERAFASVSDELDVLLTHGQTYKGMEKLSNGVTNRIARVLRIWDLSTFHPLVLWVNAREYEEQEKLCIFRLIESYIVRREICNLTTKNYNKVGTTMIRQLSECEGDPIGFAASLKEDLTGDASRLPNDGEVLEAIATKPIYSTSGSQRLRYILQQIEHAKRTRFDESVEIGNLTVEHIMPRKWAEHWPLPSGVVASIESTFQATLSNFELDDSVKSEMDFRQKNINTLGNLTIVTESLNPSLSNGPWSIKRERLAKSLLALNREVAGLDFWNEEAIQARAKDLGTYVNTIWASDV
tara:strand:+ start:28863 stop:30731 length:1869 start_codon:yes stop_codon:yes gene_type:complete